MFATRTRLRELVVSFLVLICLPGAVSAHGLRVFAWVEGDTCHVESYFSQSKRAENAQVDVLALNGNKLLSGMTDARGNFSFKIPVRADLRIVVTPGMGHKGDYVLRAEEMGALAERGAAGETPAVTPVLPETQRAITPAASRGPVLVDTDEFERMIREALDHSLEHALDEKLEPLYASLRETRRPQEVSLRDVIAGLGYIFGIFGLALLLFQRRGKRANGKR